MQLRTDRLLLRPISRSDIEGFAELNEQPEVMRFIDGHPLSRAQSSIQLANFESQWSDGEIGIWSVLDAAQANRFLGFCGLQPPTFNSVLTPAAELGWRLLPDAWGKGYASEAAAAVVADAFSRCQIAQLISLVHPDNVASFRVAQKLGMRETGKAPSTCAGVRARLLRLDNPVLSK